MRRLWDEWWPLLATAVVLGVMVSMLWWVP
jgi:hypothetical protein